MNQLRHLGAIRFVMLGICVALTVGILASNYFLNQVCVSDANYMRAIGIVAAFLFAGFEVVASYRYKKFADRAMVLEGSDGVVFCGQKVRVLGPVTLGTLAVYGLIFLIWLSF